MTPLGRGPSLASPVEAEFPALNCCSCPQFLRDSLAVVSDNTWICQLSLEMCKQLPCYNGTPQEKVLGGMPQEKVLC